MTIHDLARMFEYANWANERACDAVGQLSADVPEQKDALRLLGHILGASQMWRSVRLQQIDIPGITVWPALDLEECRSRIKSERADFQEYLASLKDTDLTRPISYKNLAGEPFTSSLQDILMHVVNHMTHHRGQIMQLVRQGGGAPPSTDYIAFTRLAPNA